MGIFKCMFIRVRTRVLVLHPFVVAYIVPIKNVKIQNHYFDNGSKLSMPAAVGLMKLIFALNRIILGSVSLK